jgi:predicted lipoprotein
MSVPTSNHNPKDKMVDEIWKTNGILAYRAY